MLSYNLTTAEMSPLDCYGRVVRCYVTVLKSYYLNLQLQLEMNIQF